MRQAITLIGFVLFAMGLQGCATGGASDSTNAPATGTQSPQAQAQCDKAIWAVTIDNIEACSCPAFCQCYFSGAPALHEQKDAPPVRYCRFTNAFQVTKGHYKDTKLDGMKIWMAGDLGGDFTQGLDWCVLRFEPSATPDQRAAATEIVKAIFNAPWKSFTVGADAKIDWQKNDTTAVAKLNDGKSGEVSMKGMSGADGKPVVIDNVKFWAAPSSSGFVVMPNEIEAYRDGDKPFEFKGTNGFFNTISMSSNDLKPAHAMIDRLETASACTCGRCCAPASLHARK